LKKEEEEEEEEEEEDVYYRFSTSASDTLTSVIMEKSVLDWWLIHV
jgi:hypothetical protein